MPIQKKCAATGQLFTVRDEDLAFYNKISPVLGGRKYKVTPPTLHPDERVRRRMAYRNERTLYKRKSELSGREVVSVYNPDSPVRIFTHEEWWSDD